MPRPPATASLCLALVLSLAATPSPTAEGPAPEGVAAAERALEEGRFGAAEEGWRGVIRSGREEPRAYLGLAAALAGQGRGAEAAALLRRTGEGWIRAGDAAGAAVLLGRARELAPDDAGTAALLGRALALEERWAAALGPLEAAVAGGRADPVTLLYLGSVRWENGDVAGAEAAFRRVVAEAGRPPVALAELGELLLWAGRAEEAVPLLEEAARRAAAPDVLMAHARALAASGRAEDAAAAWRRAAAAAPEAPAARYGLGRALLAVGEREEGEAELERAKRLYREERERTRAAARQAALEERGRDLLRRGEAAAAVAHLEGLEPTPDALALLARARLAAGDGAGAVEAAEAAVAASPGRDDLRAALREVRLVAEGGG